MNAKELILAKINATTKFVDIYTYLISTGMPFAEIADFMKSPIFDRVVKYTETNIYDPTTKNNNTEKALGFYLGKTILPIVDFKQLRTFVNDFTQKSNYPSTENWIDILWNNDAIEKMQKMAFEAYQAANVYDDDLDNEMESYLDEYDFDDDYSTTAVKIDAVGYRQILRFLNDCKIRNDFMEKQDPMQIKKLELVLENVLPATEEMKILGRMLKINQGIVTDDYAKYSYIKGIENYINRRFNILPSVLSDGTVVEQFNLIRFINDSDYKNKMIKQYDSIKRTYNILEIIEGVPHFKSMFDILAVDDYILREYSVKYDLEREVANSIIPPTTYKDSRNFQTMKLNESEFYEVKKFVEEILILNYLSQQDDLTFTVRKGRKYFSSAAQSAVMTVASKDTEIKLDTMDGLASFKYWMDNYVIPELKNTPSLKDNAFIQNLVPTLIEDKKLNTSTIFYRLNINMMQIDSSVKNQELYSAMANDFDVISRNTFEGWAICDLFYLYNLLVSKDGFGQNSMTRIFEKLIHSENSTHLINAYNDFIAKLDSKSDEDVTRNTLVWYTDDIKNRIAKKVKNSRIAPAIIRNLTADSNYYTFYMPLMSKKVNTVPDKDAKPIELNEYKLSHQMDRVTALQSVVELMQSKNIPIHLLSNEEALKRATEEDKEQMQYANAWIENGEVYINQDKATGYDALHEYAHLIFAAIKFSNNPDMRKVYYDLIAAIKRDSNMIAEFQNKYSNSHGSDLLEEILVYTMSEYLSNNFMNAAISMDMTTFDNNLMLALQEVFKYLGSDTSVIENIFDKANPIELGLTNFINLINLVNNSLLGNDAYNYSEENSNAMKLSQQVATIKDILAKNKDLTIICK